MSTIRFTLDGRELDVPEGQTILEAARTAGLDIPTLCYLECVGPLNSCLVCVVKVTAGGATRVLPACGARVQPGMKVESETPEVHALRRSALELLLSDHVGDCLSPCHRICPLGLNIPQMLRQIQAGHMPEATATLKAALPLGSVLGRLCNRPCENGCRRGGCDSSAAIRDLERHVADWHLAAADPWLPPRRPATGKRVAIVGAGPAGLSAAYTLLLAGHACTLFDRNPEPGGTLRAEIQAGTLPAASLAAEFQLLTRLGLAWQPSRTLGTDLSLAQLAADFDAVLLAVGELGKEEAAALGLAVTATGIKTDPNTGLTSLPRVHATGSAVKPVKAIVRAMADGQLVAEALHDALRGVATRRVTKPFSSMMGRVDPAELKLFLQGVGQGPRVTPARGPSLGYTPDEAVTEAGRCLHCDCRAAGNCRLQEYAQAYGASFSRFSRQRRPFEQHHHPGNVLFEPGKCILCGICVELAKRAAEPLGLTFVGRGFNVRVGAPMHRGFSDALQRAAQECVDHCPTGALAFADPAAAPGEPGPR